MTLRRCSLAAAIVVASIASSAVSRAQDAPSATPTQNFGRRSHLIVSIENVAGGASESVSESSTGDSLSYNSNGLFAGYTGPRFGVHAAFGPSITAGSGISVWAAHDTTSRAQTFTTTVVRLAPRLGWVPALGPLLALWLRAGPTLVVVKGGQLGDTLTFWDLSFDALVAWTPYRHFGVIAGPQFDVGISGKSNTLSDIRYQSTGFFVGLFVDL